MGSWAKVSVLTNQFIPRSTTNTESGMDSKLGAGFYKIYRNTNKRKLGLSFARYNYKVRSTGAMKFSQDLSYFKTEQEIGTWEEPDTGSDSECDDEEFEEVEDENIGFESDLEEEGMKTSVVTNVNITSGDNYEELIKKVVVVITFDMVEQLPDCGICSTYRNVLKEVSQVDWRISFDPGQQSTTIRR